MAFLLRVFSRGRKLESCVEAQKAQLFYPAAESKCFCQVFFLIKKICLLIFEKEEGREKKKHELVGSIHTLTRDWTRSLGLCPDRYMPSFMGWSSNQLSHTGQGSCQGLNFVFTQKETKVLFYSSCPTSHLIGGNKQINKQTKNLENIYFSTNKLLYMLFPLVIPF